jgi:hypothetical protein
VPQTVRIYETGVTEVVSFDTPVENDTFRISTLFHLISCRKIPRLQWGLIRRNSTYLCVYVIRDVKSFVNDVEREIWAAGELP